MLISHKMYCEVLFDIAWGLR